MPLHVAPTIREMEQCREGLGNIQNLDSTAYTETVAAEGVTRPTPHVSWGNFWLLNQKTTPAL
jgi:hypothetical protein